MHIYIYASRAERVNYCSRLAHVLNVERFYISTVYSKERKNICQMNKEVGMLLPKKDLIQVE